MGYWTLFYWGWWIAWSPFVGTFIAQISQGRTVRVFILGNMMVPALVTCLWTTTMGGLGAKMEYTAMEMGLGDGCMYNANFTGPITNGTITRLSCADVDQQMFMLIEHYPMSQNRCEEVMKCGDGCIGMKGSMHSMATYRVSCPFWWKSRGERGQSVDGRSWATPSPFPPRNQTSH